MSIDSNLMLHTIKLAEKGRGRTSPNPLVGAVVVKNGNIIGEGYHEAFGLTHAEVNALHNCKESPEGATLYVNLEPCSIHGKTPPCVDTIIQAGIKRVVVGIIDPNPEINGAGIAKLRQHGIEVTTGICEKEARVLNKGFISLMKKKRPFISLKMAATIDGYIADMQGKSQWITSESALEWVHQKRVEYDAVMVGFSTAFKDNPRLTTRGRREIEPYRIVIDESLSLPGYLHLMSDEWKNRTVLVTSIKASDKKEKHLTNAGVTVIRSETDETGWIDLEDGMRQIGKFGITSVFVEGGSQIAGSLIQKNLIDEIYLFIAPKAIGKGIPLFSGFVQTLDNAITFQWHDLQMIGNDCLLYGLPDGG